MQTEGQAVAIVSLIPLQKTKPYLPLPPYYYPTRTKLQETLQGLGKLLSRKLIGKFGPPEIKSPPYHDSLEILRQLLGNVEAMLLSYLDVHLLEREPVWNPNFSAMTASIGERVPTFQNIQRGLFYQDYKVARLVEQAEKALAPNTFPIAPWKDFQVILDEHLAWVKVVRLCIAIVVVNALDYQTMWKSRDGDAGWWLSEKVGDWAAALTSSVDFNLVEINFLSEGIYLEDLGLKDPILAQLKRIRRLLSDIHIWRSCCPHGCPVRQLGNEVPFEFTRIDSELVAPRSDPVTMHARPKVIRRAWTVRNYWEKLVEKGVISKEFQVVVNAGTLLHGGAHPPHAKHRDGSMLDLDITWSVRRFPDLVRLDFMPSEPETKTDESTEDIEDEPVEEPEEVPPDLVHPTKVTPILIDWVFPEDNDRTKLTRVAVMLTRCIYLTLPKSLIFASWWISVIAKADILDKLNKIIEKTKDERQLKTLIEIQTLTGMINPVPWRGLENEDKIRYIHRNHWHVNYNPDRLGDESHGLHPSNAPQLADRIDAALRILHPDNDLWLELVKD